MEIVGGDEGAEAIYVEVGSVEDESHYRGKDGRLGVELVD